MSRKDWPFGPWSLIILVYSIQVPLIIDLKWLSTGDSALFCPSIAEMWNFITQTFGFGNECICNLNTIANWVFWWVWVTMATSVLYIYILNQERKQKERN